MSLSDVVSHADMTFWAEGALILFFLAFLGIVAYVFIRRRSSWDHTRNLPLEDNSHNGSQEDSPR
jgi:cbb3-type cytochrome oxidase subunit 3